MKKQTNTWLLIKQGFKSLFKYKVQLCIVFILTFIASLLLTVTMSSVERIQNNYNSDVKTQEKFDYTYEYQTDKTNIYSDSSIYFAPFFDIFPDYSLNNDNVTSYNIDFVNGKYKDIFKAAFEMRSESEKWLYEPSLASLVKVSFDPYTNTISYNPSIDVMRYSWGDGNGLTKDLRTAILNELWNTNDLKQNSKLQDSLLYRYIKTANIDPTDENSNIYKYINFVCHTITLWFQSEIVNYFTTYINEAINYYYNAVNDGQIEQPYTDENFNSKFNAECLHNIDLDGDGNFDLDTDKDPDTKETFFEVTTNDISQDESKITTLRELSFAFITGKNLDQTTNNYGDFALTDDNKYTTNASEIESNNEVNGLDSANQIYTKGFKGILNPIVKNGISQQAFLDSFEEPFLFTSNFLSLNQGTQIANGADMSYDDFFYIHQLMAAQTNNFDLKVRNEVFAYNNKTSTSFRVVLIQNGTDYYDTNINLFQGRMPLVANEVIISPQYAKANKIKLGDTLYIGGATTTVVGFGSDAYSFIPAADKDVPVPNPSKSAIVYTLPITRNNIIPNEITASKNTVSEYTNVFLTSKHTINTNLATNLNSFLADIATKKNALNTIIDVQKGNTGVVASSFSNISPKEFNKSNYSYSWTILPIALNAFGWLFYVGTVMVLGLAMMSLWIGVKKNIQRNASEIAILKAMGLSSSKICLSYLSYSWIITFCIVPVAWIFGIFAQMGIVKMFSNFFSLNYNELNFAWMPLLLSIVVFGVLSFALSYWSAMRLLNRSFVEISQPGHAWKQNKFITNLKNTAFKKASFNTRFRLQIASSSVKRITLMSIVIIVASLLITASLSIPSIISNVADSYYKNLNYKNQFTYNKPIYNSPLSKSALSSWEGPETYENDYNVNAGMDLNSDGKPDGQYNNVDSYFASSQGVSGFPMITYNKDESTISWTADMIARDSSQTVTLIGDYFGNNYYEGLGSAFSMGMASGLMNWVSRTNALDSDQARINAAQTFTNGLSNGICSILGIVLNVDTSANAGEDWIDCTTSAILTQMPPYVSNYVNQSLNRQQQFAFGWNYVLLQDKKESLSTSFDTNIGGTQISTVGLQEVDSQFNLNNDDVKKTKNMFIDRNTLNDLDKILRHYENNTVQDINTSELGSSQWNNYYDVSSNTLTVPVIANQQALVTLDKDNGDTIDNNARPLTKQMQYLTKNGYQPLLKQYWVYDDTDFVNYAQNNSELLSSQQADIVDEYLANNNYINEGSTYYLSPFGLDNNKFTLKSLYDNSGDLINSAYMFVDGYAGGDQYEPLIRSYYSYENLYLYLPADNLDESIYVNPDGDVHTDTSKYFEVVNANVVPDYVKQGVDSTKWLKIKPYSLTYDNDYSSTEGALSNLLNKTHNWFYASSLASQPLLMYNDVNTDAQNFNTYNDLKINYKIEAVVDTYGNAVLYTSNDFANLMLGYDTSQAMQFNYQPNSVTKDNEELVDDNVLNSINSSNYYYATLSEAPYRWFTDKYSDADEAYDLTTYYSDSTVNKSGSYLITAEDNYDSHGSIVASQNLLSQKQALINQVESTFIPLSILIITIISVCSVLLILMIANIFISQYERFMLLMKVEGYTKLQIFNNTLNIFTPFVVVAALLGGVAGYVITKISYGIIIDTLGIAAPLQMAWWAFVIGFVLVMLVFSASFLLLNARMSSKTVVESLSEAEK